MLPLHPRRTRCGGLLADSLGKNCQPRRLCPTIVLAPKNRLLIVAETADVDLWVASHAHLSTLRLTLVSHTNMSTVLAAPSQSKSIWIVDDNETFRTNVVQLLRVHSRVQCKADFGSMEQVLMQLRSCPDVLRPDILLVDIALPGISGLDGIARAKAMSPESSVVMMTASEDPEQIMRAFRAGATGFVIKSQIVDELDQVVDELADGGVPMTTRAARGLLEIMACVAPVAEDTKCRLSGREQDILTRLVDGLTKKEIAEDIGLSVHTVNTHLRRIYDKLRVNTNTAAVATAIRQGLV